MQFKAYTVEDFLMDESFKDWVRNPSPATEQYWQSFIHNFPDKKKEMARARQVILSANFQRDQITTKEKTDIYRHIQTGKTSKFHEDTPRVTLLKPFPWYWNVAAILLVMLGSVLWLGWDELKQANTEEPAIAQHRIIQENPRGQKHQFALPDGSTVWLNAESRLEYPEPFSPDTREVTLQGEAFFEVVSDQTRPFIIKTDEVTTTVLGTSFNISAYPEDCAISVSVATGKVEVDGPHVQKIMLLPTEQANYEKEDQSIEKTNFNPEEILGWKDGLIYFKEASFKHIVEELERWYNVEITVDNIQKYRRFSGEFRKQSLENVLNGISFSLDFDYKMEGKHVYIFTKN